MNYKKQVSTLFILILPFILLAQEYNRDWRINLGVGYGIYFGDLSHYRIRSLSDWKNVKYFINPNQHYIKKPSFHLSFEKRLSERTSVLFSGNLTNVMMSDRYINSKGSFERNNIHFSRALNFRAEVYDLGVNYKMMSSQNALISSLIWFGAGVSYFRNFGDLYDPNGNRYNYTSAVVVTDGIFETNLRDQLTETESRYRNIVPFVNLGLGLDFKISNTFTLGVESDIKYSFSDYIDDVSAQYRTDYTTNEHQYIAYPGTNAIDPITRKRGNNDGVNDFYIQNRLVLRYKLFANKNSRNITRTSFKAPAIYPVYYDVYPNDDSAFTDTIRTDTSHNVNATKPKIRLSEDPVVVADSLYGITETSPIPGVDINKIKESISGSPDTSYRNFQRRIDSLEKRVHILEQKPVSDMYSRKLDSLNNLLNRLKAKPRLNTVEQLHKRIYTLQIDSLKNDAEKKGIEISLSGTYPGYDRKRNEDSVPPTIRDSNENDPVIVDQKPVSSPTWDTGTRQLHWQKQIDSLERIRQRYSASGKDVGIIDETQALQKRLDSLENILRDTTRVIHEYSKDSVAAVKVITIKDTISGTRLEELERKLDNLIADDSLSGNPEVLAMMHDANAARIVNDSMLLELSRQKQLQIEKELAKRESDIKWHNKIFKGKKTKELEETREKQEGMAFQNEIWQNEINRLRRQNEELEDRLEQEARNPRKMNRRNDRQFMELDEEIRSIHDQLGRRTYFPPVVTTSTALDNSNLEDEIRALRQEISNLRNDSMMHPIDTAFKTTEVITGGLRDSLSAVTAMIDSLNKEMNIIKNNNKGMKDTIEIAKPLEGSFAFSPIPVSIYFDAGSSSPSEKQLDKIGLLRSAFTSRKEKTISLQAFTDATGNKAINETIARKRANAVKNYIIKEFKIDDEDILIDINPGNAKGGKKANPLDRRVDILVLNKEL